MEAALEESAGLSWSGVNAMLGQCKLDSFPAQRR